MFYGFESLRSGKYNESLLSVIEECEDVLLVLSPGGLDQCDDENDWMRREILYAYACD